MIFGRVSRRARFRAATLVAVVAALIGTTVGVATEAAASSATVVSVHAADSGGIDVRLLDSGALWVQVTVRASSEADAADLASTDDLTYRDDRGWYTDTPLQLPAGTPYGDYPVDVDYRLADGVTQHWVGAEHGTAGLFGYRKHAVVAGLAFDRATTDYDHQSATLSGRVDVFDPAAAPDPGPAAVGTSVAVRWTARVGVGIRSGSATATVSAADGTFAVAITPGGALEEGTAVVTAPAADVQPSAPTPLPVLDVDQIRVRLVAGPAHARVHTGGSFTVSGTAQRLTDSGWKALAGASVITGSIAPDTYNFTIPGRMGSGVSSTTGRFSYPVKAVRSGTYYTYVPYSSYVYDDDTVGGRVDVPTAGRYSTIRYSLDAYGTAKAVGSLGGVCGNQRLTLQFSSTGRSGWVSIGATTTDYQTAGHACAFTISANGGRSGYYHVTHAESDQMLVITSAHSGRLARTPTRITGFALSPTRPRLNSTMQISGTVTQYIGGTWRALRSAHVVVVIRPKGESTFYWVVKGTTSSTGHFSLRGKVYGDGYWGVYYAPDAAHFYSETPLRYVDAR